MARRTDSPAAPRVAAPDLPAVLDAAGLSARGDLLGARIDGLSGQASGAHGRLAESRISAASVDRLDLAGASLSDVAIDQLKAVELIARDGSWRGVEIVGGRISTFDGLRAEWDSVVLRGIRIDYLSLPSAVLGDVLIAECEIGTLDVPDARLTRVRFENSRADEVDTRGLRAVDLDLRGLEALSFTDPRGLSGATLAPRQAELHAPAFAAALGIRLA
ncbi:MAG TPA: hypothetical protein VEP72_07615 [Microbacterium sp.]|nr:hypothetical protein [Microbacterium sp.]